MDQRQSQLRTTEASILEVVRENGSISIMGRGTQLLQGKEHDGRLHMHFTEWTGAGAEFPVTGDFSPAGTQLSGTGTIHLGALTLHQATVHVTPSAIAITAPVDWADHPAIARFEFDGAPGCWRGRIDARETLSCLITRREVLRTSITIELDLLAGQSRYLALAVLDGRNIEVPMVVSNSHGLLEGTFSSLRQTILSAVRAFLLKELTVSEAKFAAASSDDDTDERPVGMGSALADDPVPNSNASHGGSPVRQREVGSDKGARGYLPAPYTLARESGQAPNLAPRGYVDNRFAHAASTLLGYLPATPSGLKATAGYLPGQRTRVGSASPGYLPAGWNSASEQTRSRTTSLQEVKSDGSTASRAKSSQSEVNTSFDIERIAYAVLRCKDLLQAIGATEVRGPHT